MSIQRTVSCSLLTAVALHLALSVSAAQVESKTRILSFPADRSMGTIYVGQPAETPYAELEIFSSQLKKIGPAKGNVEVPRGVFVRLDVSRQACEDLSPLSTLPPDSIHFLYFNGQSPISGQLKHISSLKSLRVLHLRSCPVKDEDIEHIAALIKLESVQCSVYGYEKEGFGITDASMKVFGQMPHLKQLLLRSNPITDKGLDPLVSCESLESLSLNGSKVTGEGLNSLMMLPSLKSLSLGAYRDGSPVNFEGMKTFGNLIQLEHLNLSGSKISDEELAQIRSLKNLKSLTLDYSNVTDAGLEALEDMDRLERFRFYRSEGGKLGDRAAFELAKLPNLKKITAHWNLTPTGIRQLARMKKLESIDLSDSVTDGKLKLIAKMSNLRRLRLQNCPVTDDSVKLLESMDKLEHVSLFRTQATAKCIESIANLNLTSFTLVTVNEVFETWPSGEFGQLEKMQTLERLKIGGFLLGEDQWKTIGRLRSLKSLEVDSRLPLDSSSVKAIAALTSLESLDLTQCRLAAKDAQCFMPLRNLEYISLDGELGEDFLIELAKLPSLRVLQIAPSSKLSLEAQEKIKKASDTLQSLFVSESRRPELSKNAEGLVVEGNPADRKKLDRMIGKPHPKLLGTDGEFDLSQFKGRPVIVHFWRARRYSDEIPPSDHIANVVSSFPDHDIQILGVHRSAGADKMRPYMANYGVSWPCIIDMESQTAKLWQNPGNGRDHLYLIGPDGKLQVARIYIGDLENALRTVLPGDVK